MSPEAIKALHLIISSRDRNYNSPFHWREDDPALLELIEKGLVRFVMASNHLRLNKYALTDGHGARAFMFLR